MLVLLLAVFFGGIVVFQVTGTTSSMAAENVQMAVDLESAATSFSLFTPLIIVIAATLFLGAILSMSQGFGAAYDAGKGAE